MLAAKINGQWLESFPQSKLKYVFNSPAFSDSPIVGDFSYSLSFPSTAKNNALFGFVDRADKHNPQLSFEMELYDENILLVNGSFVVKTATQEKVSGNLINSAFSFSNLIEGKTTKDIDLGETITFESGSALETHMLASYAGGYPQFNFARFPILNSIYKNGTNEEEAWNDILYINKWNPSGDDYVLFPYLAFVLKQLFSTFDYKLDNAQAADSELVKLCLIGLYRENLLNTYPVLEYNLTEHIIKCDLKKLLTGVNSLLCSRFFFDHKRKAAELVFLKSLLTAADYTDWSLKVRGQFEKTVEEIKSGFGLSFEFDSSDETISKKQIDRKLIDQAQLSDPVLTPDDLPAYSNMGIHAGEIRYVTAVNAYYMIADIDTEPTVDFQWTLLTLDLFQKLIGSGEENKTSVLSTLAMSWHMKKTGNLKSNWLTPESDQALMGSAQSGTLALLHEGEDNYELTKVLANEFEPRVLFFRGLQKDLSNLDYPLGTMGRHDAQGNEIGQLALRWDGADGLYENFWKDWLSLLSKNKIYTFEIQLNLTDVLNLDMKRKVKIDNNYYLIRQLTIDLPIEKPATVELIQI